MTELNESLTTSPVDSSVSLPVPSLYEICQSELDLREEARKTHRKLPYEVRLHDFARLIGKTPSMIRDAADKANILRRWPVYGNPIYLVRNEEEEQILGINGHCVQEFDGHINHDIEEGKSIIFADKHIYPYYVSTYRLARRVKVNKELIEQRAARLGLAVDSGCEFISREEEIMFLYTKLKEEPPTQSSEQPVQLSELPIQPSKQEFKRKPLPIFPDLEEIELSNEEYVSLCEELEAIRPRTRADCEYGIRPCIFLSCRYHLGIQIDSHNGEYKIESKKGLFEREETCVLDVAELGGVSLERIGEMWGLTRERIRQIQELSIEKLERLTKLRRLYEEFKTLTNDESLKRGRWFTARSV